MYHVEISAGFHRARVFNLDQGDVMAKIVQPWLEERAIEMGDREWKPRESSLRILEGPEMKNQDLSFGQGWANAERASENVTREILDTAPPPAAPDAFIVVTDSCQTGGLSSVSNEVHNLRRKLKLPDLVRRKETRARVVCFHPK